jgi:hypothetical protein
MNKNENVGEVDDAIMYADNRPFFSAVWKLISVPDSKPSRPSIGMTATNATVAETEEIGLYFKYVQRSDELASLREAFACQETQRIKSMGRALRELDATWERYKRGITVPVCMGLSGIGKSRFARMAGKICADELTAQGLRNIANIRIGKPCNDQFRSTFH